MERHIVICAPTGQDALLTSKVLGSVSISTSVCTNVTELIEQLQQGAGALLLVEEVVSIVMRELADFVAGQPTWSDLPILLLTHGGPDSADVRRAVDLLGNVTLIEKPVRTIALIAVARSAIRARERQYQVRDADKRKDEFLATLAHELRNPLAPIRNSMGILRNLAPTSGPINSLGDVVERQVTHLTRLVDDLLDVARITTGKVVLKKGYTSLQAVVNHAVEISGSGIAAKGHKLLVEQPEHRHLLYADQARLVQSLANLLVNAAKFTPGAGKIVLRASVAQSVATFSVRDNGIGLEPESLQRIFDLFAQTPVPGQPSTGLGIGLSLARQFAEMHDGELRASSDGLGKGSEFILTLPVVVEGELLDDQESIPMDTPDQIDLAVPEHAALRKKVLVVDDNVDAADTLGALLDMDGFDVRIVYDGLAAVDATRSAMPDVVVMDIGMPGMDGYDAARLVRGQPGGKQTVLVALTGWGQSADRQRASEAGFDHHLVKPVDYDCLMKCLD